MTGGRFQFQGRPLDDLPGRLRTDTDWYHSHIVQGRCWYCRGKFAATDAPDIVIVGVARQTYRCRLHPTCAVKLDGHRDE